jgi:carbon monoxide dehydrogenase subunit G
MQLKGEEHIPLDRAQVWSALNDPEILKASIPGCESLEATPEGFRIGMLAAVGPVRARFNGKLALADVNPPDSYTLVFEGSGGIAGYGKGSARVSLSDAEGGTRLAYDADAQVGGKIAQVGSRLVDGVAARIAAEFFARFKARIAPPPAATEDPAEPAAASAGRGWKIWT